jgi:hypothetical protein
MKQINSNPIRKQFGPVPIFSIAASIIMAITSVSPLHSRGSGLGPGSLVAGALYSGNEVLRDDVSLTARLSSFDHLYSREYAGGKYESTASISSLVNATDLTVIEVKYEYTREVFAGLHGKLLYHERDTKSAFKTWIGDGPTPEELEAEAQKEKKFPRAYFLAVRAFECTENASWKTTQEDHFAYNIAWKYTPKENGEWWWRNERHFQLTLSNWKNQQMSCGESYPENSAYFTTEKPIKKMDRTGGIIKALPYNSLFGRVNIGANTQNASLNFEPINKFFRAELKRP